jgi:hypothetical protein
MTINDLIQKIDAIYGVQDDRLYDLEDHFYYERKFLLRYLDAKNNENKTTNFLTSLAWFLGVIRRFHLNLDKDLFSRYPYKCPFCMDLPCSCQNIKNGVAQKTGRPTSHKPKNLDEWQKLAAKIYRHDNLADLSLEILKTQDKLHYLFRSFHRTLGKTKIKDISHLTSDYFMLVLRLFNLLNKDLSKEFKKMFGNGCYVCHNSPCTCYYFE